MPCVMLRPARRGRTHRTKGAPSAPRRFLQVCSILLFAAAGLAIVYAVLLIASGGTPSPLLAALGGDVLDRTTATATGLGLIVLGVVDIIIGIVGLMGVRHPEKAMPILVISVLESAMSAYGCLTAFSYGNLISTVFCLAMAVSAWVVYSERKRTAR